MPSNSDPASSDEVFKKLEAKLSLVRSAVAAPKPRLRMLSSSRQEGLNVAVVRALEEAVAVLRKTVAAQAGNLQHLEQEVTDLHSLSAGLRDVQERLASAEAQLAQWRQEEGGRIDQLSAGQRDLGGELRERIQHLLEEQRVCLRQLSLKTSEEAVLADRARRATELRLEELARRIPPEKPA
jgi:chromosome segregation ATPase